MSPLLLDEYEKVIRRPHIRKKYAGITARRDDLLRFLRTESILVAGTPTEHIITDDPDDDVVLACAVEGEAEYTISGDSHLKELGEYKGIRILSPRDFAEEFGLPA